MFTSPVLTGLEPEFPTGKPQASTDNHRGGATARAIGPSEGFRSLKEV